MNAIRQPSVALALLLTGLLLATAACSTSGGLGQVPTVPPTAAPSIDPGPPDETPAASPSGSPSGSPSASPSGSPSAPPSSPPSGSPSPSTPTETMVVRAYYVLEGAPGVEGMVPTLRVVPKTTGVARAAMGALLDADPIRDDYSQISTAIPAGTRLLGISIKSGVATVDLSREFESGGGSASARYRLAQVVYTLTQFPTVRAVLFQIEGRTVTTFGAEGIQLDGPQNRKDFEGDLPSIFVDRPAFGAAAGNPARITGNANVFEATFRIAILDASKRLLVDRQAMATCGTGCRGTFDVTLRYDIPRAQWGTLRTYFGSASGRQPRGHPRLPGLVDTRVVGAASALSAQRLGQDVGQALVECAQRGAVQLAVVRVDLADRQGHPVRRGDEFLQHGDELREAKPHVSARFLGDREVEVVQDVHVDVDQEAPEASRPALDHAAGGARRVSGHARQSDLFDPSFVDDPTLERRRVVVGEEEHLVRAQHRGPRTDPGEDGDRAIQAQQMGHAHPVEGTVLDAFRCVQVAVEVDVDKPEVLGVD